MKKYKGVIFWTVGMYVCMTFLFPLIEGSEITLKHSLISLPVWVVGGIGMAYVDKRYNKNQK